MESEGYRNGMEGSMGPRPREGMSYSTRNAMMGNMAKSSDAYEGDRRRSKWSHWSSSNSHQGYAEHGHISNSRATNTPPGVRAEDMAGPGWLAKGGDPSTIPGANRHLLHRMAHRHVPNHGMPARHPEESPRGGPHYEYDDMRPSRMQDHSYENGREERSRYQMMNSSERWHDRPAYPHQYVPHYGHGHKTKISSISGRVKRLNEQKLMERRARLRVEDDGLHGMRQDFHHQGDRLVPFPMNYKNHTQQDHDVRRERRLARNRATARLRRQRKKTCTELYEQRVTDLEQAMESAITMLREHKWGSGSAVKLHETMTVAQNVSQYFVDSRRRKETLEKFCDQYQPSMIPNLQHQQLEHLALTRTIDHTRADKETHHTGEKVKKASEVPRKQTSLSPDSKEEKKKVVEKAQQENNPPLSPTSPTTPAEKEAAGFSKEGSILVDSKPAVNKSKPKEGGGGRRSEGRKEW